MTTHAGAGTGGTARSRTKPVPVADPDHRNEVLVLGRLAAEPESRVLPSGDEIVSWRLIVDRAVVDGARKVDVVDCLAFSARVRRQALTWSEGESIEIAGALRRRFWKGAGGLQSRSEVEVSRAARHNGRRAAAAKRPRTPG